MAVIRKAKPNDKSGIKDGRIEYHRAKTGKLYSIRIEPEAHALIDKYKGSELLLNIGERTQYKNFIHRQNIELKRIGDVKRVGRGGKKECAIVPGAFDLLGVAYVGDHSGRMRRAGRRYFASVGA
ncbi:site-specific integrase [Porphyromonas gulae]|uniref:hypothetical protein n=1 Tax=Porphyromonas gulae TaxID=111105 RepID=UPI00068EFF25|nr:hypothetical protein [Porphyromonas gulae]